MKFNLIKLLTSIDWHLLSKDDAVKLGLIAGEVYDLEFSLTKFKKAAKFISFVMITVCLIVALLAFLLKSPLVLILPAILATVFAFIQLSIVIKNIKIKTKLKSVLGIVSRYQ